MFDCRDVGRGHAIVIQQGLGLVVVVDELDSQGLVELDVLPVDADFHAAEECRFKLDVRFHQRTLRIGRVESDFRGARAD